ncbi:hypothetical protein VIGAN_01360800 [Vigna angularis var. angularis]|uniref:Uncharacterized protein n=1 Tax=Vigna angularis var. angularis TaxID=157739 RepID=A0A0S3R559_PHAAN|nr:hypothetical protein VIGAN_01360800 [Vigna angularis var. angularis]
MHDLKQDRSEQRRGRKPPSQQRKRESPLRLARDPRCCPKVGSLREKRIKTKKEKRNLPPLRNVDQDEEEGWHLQEAHLRHHSGFSIAASRLALSNANFISYGEVLDQDQIWAQTSDPHRKTEHQIERLTKDPQLVPATAPFAAQSDSTSSAMTAA